MENEDSRVNLDATRARNPEHIQLANKMAEDMLRSFNPVQQVEMIKQITNLVQHSIKTRLDDAYKLTEDLKKVLETLS